MTITGGCRPFLPRPATFHHYQHKFLRLSPKLNCFSPCKRVIAHPCLCAPAMGHSEECDGGWSTTAARKFSDRGPLDSNGRRQTSRADRADRIHLDSSSAISSPENATKPAGSRTKAVCRDRPSGLPRAGRVRDRSRQCSLRSSDPWQPQTRSRSARSHRR
jgi:hypothetical protein